VPRATRSACSTTRRANSGWRRPNGAAAASTAARQGFERYRALALRLRQLDPQRADWQLEEAYAEQNLGVLDYEQQRPRQALAHWMRARQLFEPPATGAGATAAARAELSTNLGWIARAREDLGEPALAVETLGAKIALLQPRPQGAAQAATDRPGQYQRGLAHNDRSRLLLLTGQLPAALAEAGLALRELQPLVALDASNAEWRAALAHARLAQAEAHAALRQRDEAALALQAADTAAQLSGPLPATAGPRDIALRARWLSAGAAVSGAARVPLAPMTELLDRALATDPEGRALGGTRRRLLAHMALQLGDALAAQGQPEAAPQRWQQAARVLGPTVEEPLTQALRAQLLLRQGQAQEALTLADSLSSGPLRHPLYLDLLARLGRPLPAEGSR
jgi:eukaryotic-like serine/threonine-protein kinase